MNTDKTAGQTNEAEEIALDGDVESLFVDEEVVRAEVTIFGKKQIFHFRQLPAVTIQTYALVESSGTAEQIAAQMVKIVQQSLCTPEGDLVLTMARALKLKTKALTPLFYKAMQVAAGIDTSNPTGDKPIKK